MTEVHNVFEQQAFKIADSSSHVCTRTIIYYRFYGGDQPVMRFSQSGCESHRHWRDNPKQIMARLSIYIKKKERFL
ncbi:hypothetical protein THIOM_003176 [Candidatus Thiomargarita nelsonii]|uniref:Uncharacterized protein n=1 Tax=Candidatus Thiomargarita nelsonii TaxID=1003181 RepID=A0A176RZ46_9GAMM|nr:hypothetical protein THIOM_003176 [Candidatus Thiomargarita nelsonii]